MLSRIAFPIIVFLAAVTCSAQTSDSISTGDSSTAPAAKNSVTPEKPLPASAGEAAAPSVQNSVQPQLSNDTTAALRSDTATVSASQSNTVLDSTFRDDTTVSATPRPDTTAQSVQRAPQKTRLKKTDIREKLHVSINLDINPEKAPFLDFSLEEAVERLLNHNPDVVKARLEWLADQNKFVAAFGIYEPALVGNLKLETTKRPSSLLDQLQHTYSGGIEGVLPTATKYNLNFSLTDLRNNFPYNYNKPTTFAGLTLTQPLLQGLWFGKPIIDVKSAKIEREIALQKYRSSLIAKIYELEDVYWKLCNAQENLLFAAQSVDIAQEIVDDSKLQVRVGKISPLEALEATADLATRLANKSDAQKDLISAINDLKLLLAGEKVLKDTLIHASMPLVISAEDSATDTNCCRLSIGIDTIQPDYLQKKYEFEKAHLALDYQTNQCLPELNLKGTYGYVVTGNQTEDMWLKFSNPAYRSRCGTYSAEVEFRLPLGMNIRERNLRSAEKRNVQSAEIDLQSIRIQIENYLSVSCKRITGLRKNLENAKIVVDYRKTLLKAEIVRQKAGTSNYRKVFEIEEDLTKSQKWQLENIIDYKTTKAQLARLTGMTLLNKKLESLEKGKPVLVDKLTGELVTH
jgi:outer membrane protein TolC